MVFKTQILGSGIMVVITNKYPVLIYHDFQQKLEKIIA
jgi:hypothetical protein